MTSDELKQMVYLADTVESLAKQVEEYKNLLAACEEQWAEFDQEC